VNTCAASEERSLGMLFPERKIRFESGYRAVSQGEKLFSGVMAMF
jgi:hypothetical protein